MRLLRAIVLPVTFTGPKDTTERFAQLFIGLYLYGLALAIMIRGGVGLAPWDVLSVGLANYLPWTFGLIVIATSVVVLLLWIPLRQKVGVGTLANALLVGPSADISLRFIPAAPNYWWGLVWFVVGLLVLAIATGVYISANFGPGPRDGLMTGVVRVTGWPIWVARTLIEGSVLLIGWLLGGRVGVGTVLFAFGVGPLIQQVLPRMQRWRDKRTAKALAAQ